MSAPVVVVGMGGSGTRVVARILRESGVFMGTNTNGVKEDALEFAEFDYRWAPPFLAAGAKGLDRADRDRMRSEHRDCVDAHLRDAPSAPRWGWKHCPSGHLLPFLAEEHRGLQAIHVIRDGRDMAFGDRGGRTHTVRLGKAVLDDDPAPVLPTGDAWSGTAFARGGSPEATPARMARFWGKTNTGIADWGAGAGNSQYLRIRLEDLVVAPENRITEILAFVGLAPGAPAVLKLAENVATPSSIGRWREADSTDLDEATETLADLLHRFGY